MRYNPTDVTSTYASIAALNANFAVIATLLEKCVFTDGTAPNAMQDDFDLNHFRIENLGEGVNPSDAVTLQQLQDLISALNGGSAVIAERLGLIYPEAYGAVGDGTTDDTDAIVSALSAAQTTGKIVVGNGKTYAVTGTVSIGHDTAVRDITFKQLAPGTNLSVVTLSVTGDNVHLLRVAVDRNGDGTNGGHSNDAANGGLDSAYGISITGCTNSSFEDLEVYGNDTGTGIYFSSLNETNKVVRPFVHDMTGVQASGDGTDEAVCGIRFQDCTGLTIIAPKVVNLQMTYGATTDVWGTRGITTGGLNKSTVISPYVKNVGTGYDFSSSSAQADCVIVGGIADTTYSYGFKIAHDVRRWRLIGCKSFNTGDHGFFGQSASNSSITLLDENMFDGCDAVNPGGPKAGYLAGPSGFGFVNGAETNSIGAICRNCRAIDNQGSPTMVNGFDNQKTATATCLVKFDNCESIGHTNVPFASEHEDRCYVKIAADAAIVNATQTEVQWDTDVEDTSDMHSTSATPGRIFIRRDGVYHLQGQVDWAGNATGLRQIYLQKNGADILGARRETAGQTAAHTQSVAWTTIRLKKGDSIGLAVRQTSGGSLNILAANNLTTLLVSRIG